MFSRNRKLWLALPVLTGVSLALVLVFVSREPKHNGKTIRQWAEQYGYGKPIQKEEALEALQSVPDEACVYLERRAARYDRSAFWRSYNRFVRRVMPSLAGVLCPIDPERATDILWQLRPRANTVLGLVGDWLPQTNTTSYQHAIWLLGIAGEGAEQVVPTLNEACGSSNQFVRSLAVQSLAHLGPAAQPAMSSLTNALNHPRTRLRAMEALRHIGLPAAGATPALEPFLSSTNLPERLSATLALNAISPEKGTLKVVADSLSLSNALSWSEVAQVMYWLDASARPLVPVLLDRLRSEPAEWEGDAGRDSRSHAILEAIHRMEPHTREVIPVLLNALAQSERTRKAHARVNLAAWLVRFDPAEPTGIEVLAGQVEAGERADRIFAIESLWRTGPPAKAATRALKAAARDPDPEIRDCADRALKRVEEPFRNSR